MGYKCPKCERDRLVNQVVDDVFQELWDIFDSSNKRIPHSDLEYPEVVRNKKMAAKDRLAKALDIAFGKAAPQ